MEYLREFDRNLVAFLDFLGSLLTAFDIILWMIHPNRVPILFCTSNLHNIEKAVPTFATVHSNHHEVSPIVCNCTAIANGV